MTTETIKTNKCVVSLATKNSRYVDGLARLSNSLRDNASGIDFLGFIHEHSVGAPLHTDHPYGFKIHTIQRAIDLGYEQILWLDTSVFATAPIHPIFDLIEKDGFFFTENGCTVGEWTNDKTLDFYNLPRDIAMKVPMIQAGFMGFNMLGEGRYFFSQLRVAYKNNLFHGEWSNITNSESMDDRVYGHRHEQSAMSCILINQFDKIHAPGKFIQYAGQYDKQLNDSIILRCQGM